ncbi:hypothetical protein A9P82_05245 [Arachidicoccus ginsenosidimutans]|nr:hypothetical protein A9P82_05245 [Arachidicoccus sp. BS20]
MLLAGSISAVFAQKKDKPVKYDNSELQKYLVLKNYVQAKDYIDKVLQNPKEQDNKEALTYKAFIYSQLAYDSATKANYPDGISIADNVLKQLQQSTDTAQFNKLMRQNQGINAVSAVYADAFNKGKEEFAKSQWDSAYVNFRESSHWSGYILQNGFSTNPDRNAIDTFPVLYTGFSAQNAAGFDAESGSFKNPAMADSAMSIYTALADRGIAIPDMAAMYQFMIQYYQTKKDNANTDKYLAIAKQHYPDKNDLWEQLETNAMTAGGDVQSIIDNYKQKDAAGDMSEDQYAQIANSLANAEKKVTDSALFIQVNNTAIDAYEKAFAKNPQGLYAYNAGVLNYSMFLKLDDEYYASRGEGAALKAKRASIEKQQAPYADSSAYWFEKAYSILSAKTNREKIETISGNNAVKSLESIYGWKAGKAQGHDAAAFDKYDALSKKYGNLEGSLK